MSCERHEGENHQEFRLRRDDLVFTGVHLANACNFTDQIPVTVALYRDCATDVYLLSTARGMGKYEMRDAAPFPSATILIESLAMQGRIMASTDGGALLGLYNDLLAVAAKNDVDLAEAIAGTQP